MNTERIRIKEGLCIAIVLIASYSLLFVHSAHAQAGLRGLESALSITMTPVHPAPGDTVYLTVKSPVLDLSSEMITWSANGKIIAQGTDIDSAHVTAGALGSHIDIEVDTHAQDGTEDGTIVQARVAIVPTELDLLTGSDSYIPPFYLGRAQGSAGTNHILQAITRFKQSSGSYVANSDLIYTWRRNGEVIGDISGRGRASAIIPVLHLFGTDVISVDVRSSDGLFSNEKTISVPTATPLLTLYENTPLYGILYNRALGPSTFIPGSEMTFSAIPYFVQARSTRDTALSYEWHVNDALIAPNIAAPDEITINADNSSGLAQVGLEVMHATNFYMDAKGSWNVTFSADTSAQDGFHATGQDTL